MVGARVSGVAAASLESTWAIAQPITPVGFYPRFGPLPAVVEVRDQTGAWDAPGQSRTLVLSDGGSVVEHTRIVDRPGFFAYELTDFQKLFKLLVDHARAEWTFTEVEGGTLVSWSYEFFSRPRWGWAVRLIVARAWEPYMRQVLPEIVHEAERLA